MYRGPQTWLKKTGIAALLTTILLFCGSFPATAAGEPEPDLAVQVAQLAQDCQDGEGLSPAKLQEIVNRIDILKKNVQQSNHPQKKLLLIRLNKSSNLCLYLLQLQQREADKS